jgi:hypothetical protein
MSRSREVNAFERFLTGEPFQPYNGYYNGLIEEERFSAREPSIVSAEG